MTLVPETGPTGPDAGSSGVGTGRGSERPGRARLVRLLAGLCVLLIALDAALVLRVRALNERVGALSRAVLAAERPLLVEGQPFPALSMIDADGNDVPLLDPDASTATLLLVSSESCDACEEVRPEWDAVSRLCAGSHLRVLELVLDAEPERLSAREAPHPVLAPGGDAWSLVGRIPGVPAAILVDGTGSVRRSFYGAEHRGLRKAIEDELLR